MSKSVDLAILYGQTMTENTTLFSGLPSSFLHFKSITDAPEGGGLCWCVLSLGYERCFFNEFVCLGGLTVSVPCEDSYSIFGEGDGLSGFLVSPDDHREFNANADRLIVPAARFSAQQSRTPAATPAATATGSAPFVVSAVPKNAADHSDRPLPGRCCVRHRQGALSRGRPDRAPSIV
jgi:hypothetical protein